MLKCVAAGARKPSGNWASWRFGVPSSPFFSTAPLSCSFGLAPLLSQEYFLASAFVTEDGLGYASVMGRLVLLPFLGALPPKFLLEHRPPTLRPYCLASIALVFRESLAGCCCCVCRRWVLLSASTWRPSFSLAR